MTEGENPLRVSLAKKEESRFDAKEKTVAGTAEERSSLGEQERGCRIRGKPDMMVGYVLTHRGGGKIPVRN